MSPPADRHAAGDTCASAVERGRRCRQPKYETSGAAPRQNAADRFATLADGILTYTATGSPPFGERSHLAEAVNLVVQAVH